MFNTGSLYHSMGKDSKQQLEMCVVFSFVVKVKLSDTKPLNFTRKICYICNE